MTEDQSTPRVGIRFEQLAWIAFLAAIVASTVAVAKLPFTRDTNPVVDLFSGPQYVSLAVLTSLALVGWLVAVLRGEVAPRLGRAHAVLAGFFVAGVVSSILSTVPRIALVGDAGRYLGLVTWVACGVLALLASQLVSSTGRFTTLTRVLIVMGAMEAFVGLSQVFGVDIFRFAFPDDFRWMLAQGFGTLGNPNHFASILVIPFVLACAHTLLSDDLAWRMGSGASVVLIGMAAVASATRAAWLGMVFGVVLLAILLLRARLATPRTLAMGFGALLVVAAMGVLVADRPILTTRFEPADAATAEELNEVSNDRLRLWRQSATVLVADPLLGVGPDLLRNEFKAAGLGSGRAEVFSDDPHNVPLLVATSFGIVGLIAFLAYVWLSLAAPARTALAGQASGATAELIAAWLAGTAGLLVTSLFSVLSLPMLVSALVAFGTLQAPFARRLPARELPMWLRAAALVAGVAFGAWAIHSAVVPMYHNLRITAAPLQVPLTAEDIAVLDAADEALPWRYEMIQRRADRLFQQGAYEAQSGMSGPGQGEARVRGLLGELDTKVARYPGEYHAWLARARTYVLAADLLDDPDLAEQARDATAEGLRRFPNDISLEELAVSAQQL